MAENFGGAAGFGERPAVVVVDLNVGFTAPESPLACDLDDVLASTRRLLDAARHAGIPVYFTTIEYDEVGEAAAAVFLRKAPALKVLRPGTRWVGIDPRLGRVDGEPVLVKAHASAFFGVPFAALLAGRDTLIVCGASTSGCVRATVVDAMQHGLSPIIARECVGDRSPRAHEQALEDMGGRYGDVVSLEEVLAAIAQTPAMPTAAQSNPPAR
jgi:nicotinamidase-related amidase